MYDRLSRSRKRILLGLLILLLILPAFYLSASYLATKGFAPLPKGIRYSDAKEAQPDVRAILDLLAKTINASDLSNLQAKLSGMSGFPVTTGTDPLREYVSYLGNFTNKITQIGLKFDETRAELSSGHTRRATTLLSQLKELRTEAKGELKSLYGLLDQISGKYQIDMGPQRERVDELNTVLQNYSRQIDKIEALITAQTEFTPTNVTLYALREELFVGEPLEIYGFLRTQNGTGLPNRNVTIIWASNNTLIELTGTDGRFNATLQFPIGTPVGFGRIEASYQPLGPDSGIYQPSSVSVQVHVKLRPSRILANLSPSAAKPLDFVAVRGNLSSVDATPLAGRSIELQLDNQTIANMLTDTAGSFSYVFRVPEDFDNGTHTIFLNFNPHADLFAPSNGTLLLTVQLLETQLQVSVNRETMLSGMPISIEGSLTSSNGTALGNATVVVYLDFVRYATANTTDSGQFQFTVQTSIALVSGLHVIWVEYTPSSVGVRGTLSVVRVYVYNTPLVVIIAANISAAVAVATYIIRTRKRAITLMPPPEAPMPSVPTVEMPSTAALISAIDAESDDAAKIRRAYGLAQDLIEGKLGVTPRGSETSNEYLSRMPEVAPSLNETLAQLVQLFELAEYSPYPIQSDQSKQSKDLLLKLREELETVK